MYRRFGLLTVGLLLVLAALLPTQPTRAAEGIDLTTSPVPINLTAGLGSTVHAKIQVKNNSTTAKRIKVSLMKFSAYGNTGQPYIQPRQPGDDYFDWVSFSPSVLTAPTGQWVSTEMTINVPKDAGFGYYYAAVFTPEGKKPRGPGNVLLGSSAVLVLLEVQNPDARKELAINSFSVNHRVFEFLPASFSVSLHNLGNIHVVPHGDILITRGNTQVATIPFNTTTGNVLPNTNRLFVADWADGFPLFANNMVDGQVETDASGQPQKHLQWNWSQFSKLRFGKYTAHLTAVYDNGRSDVPLEATLSFWVIPWRILAGVLAVAALVVAGLWVTVLRPAVRGVKKKGKRGKPKKT